MPNHRLKMESEIRQLISRSDLVDGGVSAPLPFKAVTRRAFNPGKGEILRSRLVTALQSPTRQTGRAHAGWKPRLQEERPWASAISTA